MKTHLFVVITTLISIAIQLVGCTSPTMSEETEKELVSFMLEFVVEQQDGHADYVPSTGQPWLNLPPDAILIVYLPPNEEKDKLPWEQLNLGEPIKVWWYSENELVEATDNQVAIQKYLEHYQVASHQWPGRYEFGILSVSRYNRRATIYESSSTCPECTGGMLYTLQENDSGEWEIIDSELLWLS